MGCSTQEKDAFNQINILIICYLDTSEYIRPYASFKCDSFTFSISLLLFEVLLIQKVILFVLWSYLPVIMTMNKPD